MAETAAATNYLTYPGNVDVIGQVVGPNLFREYYIAVTQEYNEEKDSTRVGFAVYVRE